MVIIIISNRKSEINMLRTDSNVEHIHAELTEGQLQHGPLRLLIWDRKKQWEGWTINRHCEALQQQENLLSVKGYSEKTALLLFQTEQQVGLKKTASKEVE